jgi:inosose dehydratase
MNRRTFAKTIAAGAGAFPLLAAKKRKLKIGYTCITWGAFPRAPETLEPAMKDSSSLGFYSFETFPEILDYWDENLARITRLGKTIKKYGGTFAVLASNGVKRDSYDFQAHRADIVSALNDACKALNDLGLAAGLHQHTGTAIETRDEVYTVMQAVDTKHVKFAPDVGQLQKGGADAAKVVEDFLPIVAHMHLKDYSGGEQYAGYCPLGVGKVDIPKILDLVEGAGHNPDIMVELDPSKGQPQTPLETARTSKAYLQKQGYKFRT